MTGYPETQPEQPQLSPELPEKATAKTSITKSPSLREVEIRLRISELFRQDQIAASQGTKTAP